MYHRIMAAHRTVMHSAPTALASTIGLAANQLHHHDTRNADSLSVPNIRTEAGRNRLCYQCSAGPERGAQRAGQSERGGSKEARAV